VSLAASLLVAALAAAPEAPDWFRVYQYAPKTVVLPGCSECAGEPDDVCEVRSGVQSLRLEEYARGRWPAPGRLKLMRSKADPDCAVQASGPKGMLGARGTVELAAIRLARAPPSLELIEKMGTGAAVIGWPRAPQKRKSEPAPRARPQRDSLRAALVCWTSEQGWPVPAAGADGRSALQASNSCEWWLLAVKPDSGEPDLGGASFPLQAEGKRFAYGDARWARAFDRGAALDETLWLGGRAAQAEAPPPSPAAPPPVRPAPQPAPPVHCGDAARARSATLERFDQWDRQVRGASDSSLDRGGFILNAGAWSGHCQELDVLRAALEQQLGCSLVQQGRCAGVASSGPEDKR
jgi:hypothetical protein